MATAKKEEVKKIYCSGITKEGKPCKRRVKNVGDFCSVHAPKAEKAEVEVPEQGE